MPHRVLIAVAMFLALVPVTLPVPGLHELVVLRYGVSESQAHAFMTVNMLAGVVAVPFVMRRLRGASGVRRWLIACFVIDALAFAGMAVSGSYGALLAFRMLDGLVHLPAVTLLMVAANRLAGERRGSSFGLVAAALMLGVTVGSPLGGWLVEAGAATVFTTGLTLLVAGAVVASLLPAAMPPAAAPVRRYAWNRRALETWVPLGYAFLDRFCVGIFVSTFTLYLAAEHAIAPAARGALVALFMVPFAVLCYPAGRVAERRGWLVPIVAGNVVFGLVFASYGLAPRGMLPLVMVLSGIASAFMFTPALLLVSDLVRRGHGEGLFGAWQVAGSLGFLAGPVVGGVLVALTAGDGRPAYEAIFAGVGVMALAFAGASWAILRRVAAELRGVPVVPAGAPSASASMASPGSDSISRTT